MGNIKEKIQQHPRLKKAVYRFLMHPIQTRPNWWIRPFVGLFMKRGKKSIIYRSVRKDIIKDDVWIGANAVIAAGVTIGKHCVIGAGSVVTKDVPDYSVAVGNPAKVIKSIKD